MNQYSQNDSQWKKLKHGTSNSTLGATGCTITGLSMLLSSIGYDENPKTVNQKLTNNGGYLNGNLIIWSAINKIWPRAKFSWRGRSYTDDDNVKILDAIQKYGSCLVAVDGSPIGGNTKDGHWVVYIGNKRLIDPWDGLEKATTSYSATGYAVIELIQNDDEEMSITKKLFEELVTKSSKYDNFKDNGFESAKEVIEKIKKMEETISSLDKTTKSLNELISKNNSTISKMQEQISSLEEQLVGANQRIESLTEQAKKVPDLQTNLNHLTEQKNQWTKTEKTYNRKIAQLKAENERLRSRAILTLLKTSFENIVSYIKQKLTGKKQKGVKNE